MIKHHLKHGSLTFLPLLAAGCSTPRTGTVLDLTPFGFVLSAVSWLYWGLALGALVLAATRPQSLRDKSIAVAFVLAVFGYLPATDGWQAYKAHGRLAKAEAMFAERCKTAGERIHRTAENVEGILLMKIRPEKANFSDQFALTDPYGNDSGGDSYIKSFLKGYHPHTSQPVPGAPPRLGFRYAEALDSNDGKRYRYTGAIKEVARKSSILIGGDGSEFRTTEFILDKSPAPGSAPRYGVTYDDISTHEEREYWIAGSSLKVIDLSTNEVMAERIGYMMDRGQGATGGGRSPWLMAADKACPTFQRNPFHQIPPGHGASAQAIQTEDFVEKVLKPILEK